MADCSPATSQQCSEINNLNAKLAYDSSAQLQHQSLADNQEDSRAWAQLKLKTATDAQNLSNRIAQNAATIDHAVNAGIVLSGQVGTTEGQQTVSPVRTGTGDAIVGTVGVSSDAIAASLGNLATALVPVISSAMAEAISTALAALLPVVVTAAGGASTPSQTQAKPAA